MKLSDYKREKNLSRTDVIKQFTSELESHQETRLPLSDYIYAAYVWQKENPSTEARFRTPLWLFAWLCKGHPQISRLAPSAALSQIEYILGKLFQPDRIADLFPPDLSDDDVRMEIVDIWDKIRYPPGRSVVDDAIAQAATTPITLEDCPTAGYRKFLTVAACLQIIRAPEPILLPCWKLAEKLECTPMTISRYRSMATARGILVVIKRHRFLPTASEATQFHFRTEILGLPPIPDW